MKIKRGDIGRIIADTSGEYIAVQRDDKSYVIDFSSSGTSYEVLTKKADESESLGIFENEKSSFLDSFLMKSPFNWENPSQFKHYQVKLEMFTINIISKEPPVFREVKDGYFVTNKEYSSTELIKKKFWSTS